MKFYVLLFASALFLGSCNTLNAHNLPYNIAEIYSNNKITELKNQKLILLDFWATWCGPCKIATQQLEILQENLKNDIFIVSVTDETHEVVEKYMKNHSINLMVVRDYENNLIKKFNVTRRPYAVLLTNKGNIIWQGHPGDLTYEYIRNVSARYNSLPKTKLASIFNIKKAPITNTKNQTAINFTINKCKETQPYFNHDLQKVEYTGKVSSLIARLYSVPQNQITPNKWANIYVHLESPAELWNVRPDSVLQIISKQLNLSITVTTTIENVNILEVVNANKLWDNNQIHMGDKNNSTYLAGTSRLQADNTSIKELCLFLSNEKKKYYSYMGNDHNMHDWDFQFIYDDLMKDELLNEFGIRIRETKMELPRFSLN